MPTDAEIARLTLLPGFSTRDMVTEISGRGVGLDVVQSMLKALRGTVRIHTQTGRGTTFELHLPITLSVVRALLVDESRLEQIRVVTQERLGELETAALR